MHNVHLLYMCAYAYNAKQKHLGCKKASQEEAATVLKALISTVAKKSACK